MLGDLKKLGTRVVIPDGEDGYVTHEIYSPRGDQFGAVGLGAGTALGALIGGAVGLGPSRRALDETVEQLRDRAPNIAYVPQDAWRKGVPRSEIVDAVIDLGDEQAARKHLRKTWPTRRLRGGLLGAGLGSILGAGLGTLIGNATDPARDVVIYGDTVKTGANKTASIDKTALLGRLLSLPVRAFSKRHADNIIDAVDPVVHRMTKAYSSVLNTPLNEVEWLPGWARRVGGVQIFPKFLRNKTQSRAFSEAFEHFPLMSATQFVPVPGATSGYVLGTKGLKKLLGEDTGPPLSMISRGDAPPRKFMRPETESSAGLLNVFSGGGFGGGGFMRTPRWKQYDEDIDPAHLKWLRSED